jgi:hypothetical protein
MISKVYLGLDTGEPPEYPGLFDKVSPSALSKKSWFV